MAKARPRRAGMRARHAVGSSRGRDGKAATTAGEELNPLAIARQQLERVAHKLNLSPAIYERLRHPRRILTVSIPTMMDDGTVEVFTGYRVHHNVFRGPAKGGIRYHPGVTLD